MFGKDQIECDTNLLTRLLDQAHTLNNRYESNISATGVQPNYQTV